MSSNFDNEIKEKQYQTVYTAVSHYPNASNNHHHSFKKMQEFIKTYRGKIMIFIDGSNLFYTAGMMGIEIDYLKLVDVLVGEGQLLRVNFYAGVDDEHTGSINWQTFMKRTGFKMITKQVVSYADGKQKANCDVEMAVDMINLSNSFDTAVVVSGDGDLTYAVNCLINKGKQVEVFGLKANTNDYLMDAADRFIDLDSIRHLIVKNYKDKQYVNKNVCTYN
jgi:uncharacterized LabA/DUF88 family protein